MNAIQTEQFLNIYSWEPRNAKPFIYMAPGDQNYMIVNALGKMDHIYDLKGALDWWIGAPWHLQMDDGPGIELFGNA